MIPSDFVASDHVPVCPTNGRAGRAVKRITVESMLIHPPVNLRESQFRLCTDSHCPTVYYSEDGRQVFGEQDLRERLYQKHSQDDDQSICYCFQYTIGDIRRQIQRDGRAAIPEAISNEVSAGKCECEFRNPQGSCCLGNVRKLVKSIEVDQ